MNGIRSSGLPSRRRALASLAGLGAAFAAPMAAKAMAAAVDPLIAELDALYTATHARSTAANLVFAEAEEQAAAANATDDTQAEIDALAACHVAWQEAGEVRLRIVQLRSADPAALRLKLKAFVDLRFHEDWRKDLEEAVESGLEAEGGAFSDAFAASIIRDLVTAHMGALA